MRRSFAGLSTVALFLAMLFHSPLAQAAPTYGLQDGNSLAYWDLTPGAQAGMYSWTVDGVQQDFQQWFWYRIGNTAESSFDTLPLTTSGVTDTNFNGQYDTLFAKYESPASFSTTFTFLLRGGVSGSGTSDIAESIKIQNLSGAPLDFHFFQYTDLDLAGTPNNDSVLFDSKVSNNVVQQFDGFGNQASESVVTPPTSHHEAGLYPSTLASLNDGLPTTLNDVNAAGPGNVSWAYQWDLLIPAGGTILISKDKQILLIPEPSSLVMAALAAAALVVSIARRRRDRRTG